MKKLILILCMLLITTYSWAITSEELMPADDDNQAASEVAIVDAGDNTAETEVESALAEIYDAIEGIVSFDWDFDGDDIDDDSIDDDALDFGAEADQINSDDVPEGSTNFYDDDGTDANRTDEEIQDVAGAMVSDNTETRITATYDDDTGKLNLVVDDMNDDTPDSDSEVPNDITVDTTSKIVAGASLDIKNGATSSGILSIFEDSDDGTNKATFQVPALTADTAYTLPADDGEAGEQLQTNGSGVLSWESSGGDVTASSETTFTNKTYDTQGTGNVFKQYKYINLTHPHSGGAGLLAIPEATWTSEYYGQAEFADNTDKATNYVEYRLTVPSDMDTSVDVHLVSFTVRLAADESATKQTYCISMDTIASSADYTGTLAREIEFAIDTTADEDSGEALIYKTVTTLTDWKTDLLGNTGDVWLIRVARDGDNANDGSTVDTYTGPFIIRYTSTQ